MSITYLTGFIYFTDANGTSKGAYQNSRRDNIESTTGADNEIILNGKTYSYLPFIYQGAAKTKSGDNLEAQLLFANNTVAMNHANQAVVEKWNVQVDICKMNSSFTSVEGNPLTTDNWLVASMSYDSTTIELLVSSAIDAVGTNCPNRVLTNNLVGYLPTTANIRNL